MLLLIAPLIVADAQAQMCSCTVCPGAGVPTFGAAIPLATYTGQGNAVGSADLDLDGDVDLYTAAQDEGLAWYENQGGFTFALHLVSVLPLQGGFYSVDAGDVDGDGDLDLVSQAFDRDEVIWHENLGGGAFGAVQVLASATQVVEVKAADLDGDGFADALTASYGGEIAWYRSNGDGTFAPKIILLDGLTNIYQVLLAYGWEPIPEALAVGDLDGDGDLDVVAAGRNVAYVLRNEGGTFPCQTALSYATDIQSVFLGDGEGDGDLDVFTVGWGNLGWYWFDNDGTGAFPSRHFIFGGGMGYPADLDLDGDTDLLGSYENFGGAIWIDNPMSNLGDFGAGRDDAAADLDGDGDLELVRQDTYSGSLQVVENLQDCRSPDTDGDGLTDAQELHASCAGCDPNDPDGDADGLADLDEVRRYSSLLDPDSDNDGTLDGSDSCPTGTDSDGDGVCDRGGCGVYECDDVCIGVYDPDQADLDRDWVGDACDAVTAETTVCTESSWWPDVDLDGYGDASVPVVFAATAPPGHVGDGSDCDDIDAAVNPGAAEVGCNGIDDDCDPATFDDGDTDGDGVSICLGDCADADPQRFPSALEVPDGVDQDCDWTVDEGTTWYDDDGDGFTEVGGDCDDAAVAVSPAAVEVCDEVDQDCDLAIDEGTECSDDDGDGYTELTGDCHDGEAASYPGANEDPANGRDDDCDGELDGWVDDDGDGFASVVECDDGDAAVHPGATETADGRDEDCDGVIDEGTDRYDDDGDGHTELDGDCDDTDADVHPEGVEEVDGVDENCDGRVDEGTAVADDDHDGRSELGGDCDDGDGAVHPEAEEVQNGVDDDCDGGVDEGLADLDADGFTADDCREGDGFSYPGAPELCDGEDNDCDGEVDEATCDRVVSGTGAAPTRQPEGCGCRGTGSGAPTALLGLGVLLARRRRPGPPGARR